MCGQLATGKNVVIEDHRIALYRDVEHPQPHALRAVVQVEKVKGELVHPRLGHWDVISQGRAFPFHINAVRGVHLKVGVAAQTGRGGGGVSNLLASGSVALVARPNVASRVDVVCTTAV